MKNKSKGKSAATEDSAESLQFAALPYQIDRQGTVRILLVTSRETGRWIIPKGWPMKGKLPHEAVLSLVRNGVGRSGVNADYVIATAAHIRELGFRDSVLERLAEALRPPA